MPGEITVKILSEADIVVARQKGREVATGIGFTGVDLTLIATAISEVARNIVKYAGQGEILVQEAFRGSTAGLQVTAMDKGPGIHDVQKAMQDGFTTGKGLGLGLPGARRLMDDFEIRSEPGVGTTVVMKKWKKQ